MMSFKIIIEYKLWRQGKLIDSDKKEIIINHESENKEK